MSSNSARSSVSATGDPLGLAFTAGGIATGLVPGKSAAASAYSYVFDVNRQFGGHLGNG